MDIEAFIARWTGGDGGAERANYALFLSELCDVLGVERPQPASAAAERNDYVFERFVRRPDGSNGRIDLYKRDCFVLEAKQSRQSDRTLSGERNDKYLPDAPRQASLDLGEVPADARGRRGARRGWDVLMLNARGQAEDYARHLPQDHGWPPFVIVCDVGHSLELFADFRRMGKYEQFPDRARFRVYLTDLRDPEVRERLRLVWTDPYALDPSKRAARTTREIARRLAEVTKALEAKKANAEDAAHFLMRCIFTMFAEDWRLLPPDSFTKLLERSVEDPANFPRRLKSLWSVMDGGGWSDTLDAEVRHFNGGLFAQTTAFELGREEIGELLAAARADWREVEPAIFGTLLEQALDPRERKKLGAHYTPRAYVERLVTATIIDPLREDWAVVLAAAEERRSAGDAEGAVAAVQSFHDRLCETRVLDPACGTGNFLYVSLELMKRLEGEVLEALLDLGGQEALTGLESHTVDPHQFLGLELNPRAAAIAELVLWIGYLQQHFRTNGAAPGEPILRAFKNINFGRPGGYDAVLTWDGWPVPKLVDGKETYPNARRPDWPAAEFIVGNPPFSGVRYMRTVIGAGYVDALRGAYPAVPDTSDYVMWWWDRAATLAGQGLVRRFGLISTNSIVQVYSRPSLRFHLRESRDPIRVIMAIADHPWPSVDDGAAVRVSMTVGERSNGSATIARLGFVTKENRDHAELSFVNVDSISESLQEDRGLETSSALKSNAGICYQGVVPAGAGFKLSEAEVSESRIEQAVLRRYMIGRDIVALPEPRFIIDLFGTSQDEARKRFPNAYARLLDLVEPERRRNARAQYRKLWWVFAEPRPAMRSGLSSLRRFIGTPNTSKHRVFVFVEGGVLPDAMVYAIVTDDGAALATLSSGPHDLWARRAGSRMGVGNDLRYTSSRTFDPFPFPDPPELLRAELRAAGEELDAFRKARQAEHPRLTLTQMYNVREAIRAGRALTSDEARIKDEGLVLILNELHDRIDRLTFHAYGWPHDLSDEAVLERLVALNRERAAEERRGIVRWLRPDYQKARAGIVELRAETAEMELSPAVAAKAAKPAFPTGAIDQGAAVAAALLAASAPVDAAAIAAEFRQAKRAELKVAAILAAMARTGAAATRDGGKTFLFRRAA